MICILWAFAHHLSMSKESCIVNPGKGFYINVEFSRHMWQCQRLEREGGGMYSTQAEIFFHFLFFFFFLCLKPYYPKSRKLDITYLGIYTVESSLGVTCTFFLLSTRVKETQEFYCHAKLTHHRNLPTVYFLKFLSL